MLERVLKAQASRARRWKLAAGNAVVLWAVSMLGVVIVWLVAAWLLRLAFGWRVGLHSPTAIWVVAFAVPACALIAIRSTIRWVKTWPDNRSDLAADLAKGIVIEEAYRVVGAKRFQEPEHGGLIYFLRTDDDRVLALYDHESQDLGARGEDPLRSTFRPSAELTLARAPATKFVLDKRFSGETIKASSPIELSVPPREWPDNEAFCDVPWNDLERRFGIQRA